MIYTLADGSQKDIEVGDAVICIPSIAPILPNPFMIVTSVADASVVTCTMVLESGASVQSSFSPNAISQVWRKQ